MSEYMNVIATCAKRLGFIFLITFACVSGSATTGGADERKAVLHFIEDKPNDRFVATVTDAYEKAHFIRFKYVSPGTMEGLVDRYNAATKWAYSVTENCQGACLRTRSTIAKHLLTARRVDRECPLPYELVLELLDLNEKTVETFAFGLGGVCFSFRDAYYAVAPSEKIGQALADVPFYKIFLLQ
jgi:hypothetical protein